jgi:hypothetical protein
VLESGFNRWSEKAVENFLEWAWEGLIAELQLC